MVAEGFTQFSNAVLWLFVYAALVVRFLTRRFIGDYERNAGE